MGVWLRILILFSMAISSAGLLVNASDNTTMAESLKCKEGLNAHGAMVSPKNFIVTSLAYAPTVWKGSEDFYIQPEMVLVERFQSQQKEPYFQSVVPYFDPVTLVKYPLVEFFHQRGLMAIFKVYGEILDPSLKEILIKAERSLAGNRQMVMVVTNGEFSSFHDYLEDTFGFLRLFDASIYKSGPRSYSNPKAPLELILESLGKKTVALDKMRAQGFSVFEVGKYFINDSLSPEETKIVREEIRRWLLLILSEYSEDDLRNTYYFAHVVSKVNLRRYRIDYGFAPTPKEWSRGLAKDENVLMVNGLDLFHKLAGSSVK